MAHHPIVPLHNGPPTHHSLHVRDARDAHIVLEAVRLNMLPLIKRRLTATEREQLSSGNIFVWEEAENDGGLLRWTDGRRWSQSRMRGDYLFYEEKMETTQEEKDAKAALRARRTTDPLAVAPSTNRRKDRPNRPNGLTKQTYSALVYLPGSSHPRKWHVVAYFTGDDYVRLPVIESYDYFRNIRVPGGIFVSSKANGSRTDRFSYTTDVIEPYESAEHVHDGSNQYFHLREITGPPISTVSPSPSMPLPPSQHSRPPLVPTVATRPVHLTTPLPSLSALTDCRDAPNFQQHRSSQPVQLSHPSPTSYSPLSAEDRRVLNRFKIVL